jgi:Uma2 family endonuclease
MATATVAPAPPKLLTADEYLHRKPTSARSELRKGVVVEMSPPGFRHGEVCGNVYHYVDNFVRERQLGRTLTNDSGIVTERNPDTVRGADIAYYSYSRIAKDESPVGYPGTAPEIVFEVVSPSNTRKEIARKTGEYLNVGVNVVCVVDSQQGVVNLHYPNEPSTRLQGDDLLAFAELPGFSLPVRKLFE